MPGNPGVRVTSQRISPVLEVHDKTRDGYLVRTRTANGRDLAFAECKQPTTASFGASRRP
jgi:hypothetical protein